MTVPTQEWATSTVGPSCSARARRVAATESSSEVSGFCTAVTLRPAACRYGMTAAQLEPSAHAPCTSTTLRASVGAAVCARASNPLSFAANAATVSAITNRAIFIIPTPWPKLPCAALRVISVFGRWGRNVTGVHSSVNFRKMPRAGGDVETGFEHREEVRETTSSFRGASGRSEPGIHNHCREYGFRACAEWRIHDVHLHIGE